ncbi:hypothetical protein [Pediococcus parvulus]|uniref:hypothetical protein n=1 Tax=Pediococcus parvulus TaxID=54062 RepID=UPI003756596C
MNYIISSDNHKGIITSIILCAMAILFLFGFWLMMQSFILEAAEKQKKKDENNIREIAKQNKDLADELKEDHSAITQLQMDMGSIKNNLNTSSGIKEKGND